MLVVSKAGNLLDLSASLRESCKNGTNIGTWLHRDDTKLILFIDPDKESLIVVVENTTAFWPVAVKTTGFKDTISLFKEEVISDELVPLSISH